MQFHTSCELAELGIGSDVKLKQRLRYGTQEIVCTRVLGGC